MESTMIFQRWSAHLGNIKICSRAKKIQFCKFATAKPVETKAIESNATLYYRRG